jgi:DNA-binding transcriptional ArsR family regulator
MSPAGAPPVTDVFGAIAHPIRRSIVSALASGGDKPVRELAAPLPVTRPAVSQHLAVLRAVGLVSEERAGRERRYRLHTERLDDLRAWLLTLDRFWADRLGRLADHLDAQP